MSSDAYARYIARVCNHIAFSSRWFAHASCWVRICHIQETNNNKCTCDAMFGDFCANYIYDCMWICIILRSTSKLRRHICTKPPLADWRNYIHIYFWVTSDMEDRWQLWMFAKYSHKLQHIRHIHRAAWASPVTHRLDREEHREHPNPTWSWRHSIVCVIILNMCIYIYGFVCQSVFAPQI